MSFKITECPRDAMQGLRAFIPTEIKVSYINKLLEVGFDVLDCGSFVSPKAIPQMADSGEVISKLQKGENQTRLSVVVANVRGAEDACKHDNIDIIGYPFSISETFQLKNTNATIEESLKRVERILKLCCEAGKTPLLYISMAFGNPYHDKWDERIAAEWVDKLAQKGVTRFSMADTVGVASPEAIARVFGQLTLQYPYLEFSAHLHTHAENWRVKIEAAFENGCQHFESAMLGFGGCPMAGDELTGNLSTELLVGFLIEKGVKINLSQTHFDQAKTAARQLFS